MDRGNSPCPLADGRSEALNRPGPDIARREYAGQAGFHCEGFAVENPALRRLVIFQQIGAGDDVSTAVTNNAGLRGPLRLRHAAEAQKEPAGFCRPFLPGRVISERDCLEDAIPVQGNHLGVKKTLTFGSARIRSIRYSDMKTLSESSRTTMFTPASYRAKCNAAW